jgi:hypothetical protein
MRGFFILRAAILRLALIDMHQPAEPFFFSKVFILRVSQSSTVAYPLKLPSRTGTWLGFW